MHNILTSKNILFSLIIMIPVEINIFAITRVRQNKRKLITPQQKQKILPIQEQQEESLTKEAKLSQDNSQKKGLLIFLDDSEKDEFGAISFDLIVAFYQEAAPIIASSSLLYTFFEHRSKDNRPIEVLYNELEGAHKSALTIEDSDAKTNKEKLILKKHDILISKIAFKEDHWIIKKINTDLSLLIPVSYLDSLHINKKDLETYIQDNTVSDIELRLGLKVNHMKTVDHSSITRPFYLRFSHYFGLSRHTHQFSNYLVNSLHNIFCMKKDYNKKNINLPHWYICIDGHGLINDTIVNLSLYDFKKFLQFLDNEIITKLLVVDSCYVAGTNAEIIYGDIKSETQEFYSFPIIIQGINDVVTFRARPSILKKDVISNNIIKVSSRINFVDFFEKAKKLEGKYDEIIKPISLNYIENTPQIKLPGIEWFSVLEMDKKIVSIGSILAQMRDPQKPLDIVAFFKKDPEIVLLQTNTIPFELKVNSYYLRAIAPMVSSSFKRGDGVRTIYELPNTQSSYRLKIANWLRRKMKIIRSTISSRLKLKDPVQAIYRIKKISSSTHFFREMLRWFYLFGSTGKVYKWLLIDELVDQNDTQIKDVLIVGIYKEGMIAYFKDKSNVIFKYNNDKTFDAIEKVIPGSDDDNYYQERINIIRNEYPTLNKKAEENKVLSPERIEKIKNVLTKKFAQQKALFKKNSR